MTDVAALCDYLELSLTEKNHQQWDEHVRVLMNPKMLPTWLPDSLAQQLYALPDSYGVLVWFDYFGKAQAIEAHERTYSETATPAAQQKTAAAHQSRSLHPFYSGSRAAPYIMAQSPDYAGIPTDAV